MPLFHMLTWSDMTNLSCDFVCYVRGRAFPLNMKTQNNPPFIPILTAMVSLAILPVTLHAEDKKEQKELLKKAKITEADARATASAKVPDGKVKDYEIEEEHGVLVWSYDFSRPKTRDITEVQVNALTGKIQAVEVENAAAIAKEAKEDKNDKDGDKDEDKK